MITSSNGKIFRGSVRLWGEFTGHGWIPTTKGSDATTPITVYPKKYAHGFVVLCFVVVTQSFITNSHEVFIHIHQGCFAGTGAIVRLPQCRWSKPDGYGKISQCITTTKHNKAKTVCIILGIYCMMSFQCYILIYVTLHINLSILVNVVGREWISATWTAHNEFHKFHTPKFHTWAW